MLKGWADWSCKSLMVAMLLLCLSRLRDSSVMHSCPS